MEKRKGNRLALRALHAAPAQSPAGKLDTSLKRHSSLLTRLRSNLHTPGSLDSILKDIHQLSLEKYVEEAVGAVMEGITRCKTGVEIAGAVEIISALHLRFPHLFTPPFVALLMQSLKPGSSTATDKDLKEKEDNARIVRQRSLLRLLGELELVGIVTKEGGAVGEVSWTALRELLTADKEAPATAAPIGIAFAKHLGHLYLPPPTTIELTTVNKHDFPTLEPTSAFVEETEETIVSREVKDKFRKLLVAYAEALGRREGRNHVELQKTDKRNHEAYIRSGEVYEDREKNYEKAMRAWERGWASVNTLSELLGLVPPVLPSLTSTTSSSIVTSGTSSFPNASGEEIGGPGSLWQDEEDKKFYEELRELKGEVPGSVLGVLVEKEKEVEPEHVDVVEGEDVIEEKHEEDLENPITAVDEAEPTLPTGPAAQLTALCARLLDASSKSMIDECAVEFAFLNSKAARKRLIRFLASINRNRQDILPYYARLVATLDPYMPDIAKELVQILEEEFRYLQRKKQTDMAETRTKNIRFLSELTKFSLLPTHKSLHLFKVLLDDFSTTNIENLCTLLEGCGRFLLRSEATCEKMGAVLETVVRKKKAVGRLTVGQVQSLENAYYQCDPPDRPVIVPKHRTPMQLYIRHLFYNALTRNSSDKILKLVRKLDWADKNVVKKLRSAFTKVWKIKYSNVHLFAVLLYDLGRYHPEFNVGVIDDVLENVRVGLEINSFKYNQQRVATIKYLGELYNYRVIDSGIIFDTLWSLVTFGHPEGRPHPAVLSPIDSPDDSFRIRLVCTLLDTCGSCFEKGTLRKKLDCFLVFFQMYALSKTSLPMDVEFMMSDTFETLRPKLELHKAFNEAALAVDDMMAVLGKNGTAAEEEDDVEEITAGEEGRRTEDVRGEGKDGDSDGSDSSTIDADSDAELDTAGEEDDEDLARGVDPNAITVEEEDEFNRELAKMMASTSTASSQPISTSAVSGTKIGIANALRKGALKDLGMPFVKKVTPRAVVEGFKGEEKEEEEIVDNNVMTFTLLSKKGSKQQTTALQIPVDNPLALNSIMQRAADKAEQQEMKRLVLDYEEREQVTEKKGTSTLDVALAHSIAAMQDSMARRGIKLKFEPPKPKQLMP